MQADVESVTLAIPAFREVGEVPKGSGVELALFVANALDKDRFQVKTRIHMEEWMREQIWNKAGRGKELKNLEAEQILLGTISKTGGDYNASYYIADEYGDVLVRDEVSAARWENLKDQLRQSLIRQKLSPSTPIDDRPRFWFWGNIAALSFLALLALTFSVWATQRYRRHRAVRTYRELTSRLQACEKRLRQCAERDQERRYLELAKELETLLLQIQASSQEKIYRSVRTWKQMARALKKISTPTISVAEVEEFLEDPKKFMNQ